MGQGRCSSNAGAKFWCCLFEQCVFNDMIVHISSTETAKCKICFCLQIISKLDQIPKSQNHLQQQVHQDEKFVDSGMLFKTILFDAHADNQVCRHSSPDLHEQASDLIRVHWQSFQQQHFVRLTLQRFIKESTPGSHNILQVDVKLDLCILENMYIHSNSGTSFNTQGFKSLP